jgi:hypothetical protein
LTGTTDNGVITLNGTAPNATVEANLRFDGTTLAVTGNATISGDLTVSGTTTYINTTTLNIGDNIITLNADIGAATAPTENAGIEVKRGNAATKQFIWNESTDRWSFDDTINVAGNVILSGTIDTGQGATEVHLMNQNVRTTDGPTFAGATLTSPLLMGSTVAAAANTQPTALSYGLLQGFGNFTLAADTDGSQSEFAIITAGYAVASATAANGLAIGYNTLTWKNNVVLHAGNFNSYAVSGAGFSTNQNLRTTDGVTFATVNTGHGANELYAMDQNVRTSDNVSFNKVRVTSAGNSSGGNILMGPAGEGTGKWSYLTGTHFNATSQPQGVSLIGANVSSTANIVTIGGAIYEANPATEIQFYTHPTNTHNLGGSNRMTINSAGNITANVDFRAPIFYDSDNTAYFGDFASTSNLNDLRIQGDIRMEGSDSYIWMPNNNSLSTGFYDPVSGLVPIRLDGPSDGVFIGNNMWLSFNTANNNNYNENIRLFPAANGVSVIGFRAGANTSGGQPDTSILGFSSYFETRVGSTWETREYSGYAEARGSYRAPQFIDSNNTAFFIDPNGYSNVSQLNAAEFFIDGLKVLNSVGSNTATGTINAIWGMLKPTGYKLYPDEEFQDGSNSIQVYNNAGGSAVTITRKNGSFIDGTAANMPNRSGFVLEIQHAPTTSNGTSPGYGGWYFAAFTGPSSRRLLCVFKMKIPVGRSVEWASNSIGSNGAGEWLTSNAGTGQYQDYAFLVHSGTASFSSTHFFYIVGGSNATFYTYLASATVYDGTDVDAERTRTYEATSEMRAGVGMYAPIYYDIDNTAYYLNPNGSSIFGSTTQYLLTLAHNIANGDFNDALFVQNLASGQRVQIGMSTNDTDGQHHRASLRAYKGPGTYEGVFGIALRQAGSASHIQRFTLSAAGDASVDSSFRAPQIWGDSFYDDDGTFFFRTGVNSGNTRHINLANSNSDPSSVGSSTGISSGARTDGIPYYIMYVKAPYSNGLATYTRLSLGWHTGVEIGGNPAYGGTRFMNDSPGVSTTELMGVGVGDQNVRITNTLFVPYIADRDNTAFYLNPADTGTSINIAGSLRAANYNRPAILSVSSGTGSSGGSLAIQQETAEGWTGIFVDYEPYTGWGLWHDNPNNMFAFTSEGSTGQIRSFTVPSRVSGNRTAYEKFRVDQNNGDVIVGRDGYAQTSFRAPIFYDNDNTAYFINAAERSLLNRIEVSRNGAYGGYVEADLIVGHGGNDRRGFGQAGGSNIMLRSSAKSSITALDENQNLGQISYENLAWTIGENVGWGVQRVEFPGDARAPIFYDLNDTGYYVDPAGGNARIGRDLYVSGYAGGVVGNRVIVGDTSTPYSLLDGNVRPMVYIRGNYPVLTLDHTVTSNVNHGPTIQFVHNGLNNRQWVFGSTGDGISLDIGFSNGSQGNSNWNPHNGIAGYLGTTFMRFRENGNIGFGSQGDWGGIGGGEPNYAIDTRGHFYNNSRVDAPIFYDANDTGRYTDPSGESRLNGTRIYPTLATGRGSYSQPLANLILEATSATPSGYANIEFLSNYNYPSDGASITYFTSTDGGEASQLRIQINNDFNDGISLRGGYIDFEIQTVDGQSQGFRNNVFRWLRYGTEIAFLNSNGVMQANGDMRAPIFYDSNDTSYYVNPNGFSNFAQSNGQVVTITKTGSAPGNNSTMLVTNSFGNHSWGITGEFRIEANGGADRPSILFSNGFDSQTWSCGYGYNDSGFFRINHDHGHRNGSWGTTDFYIDRGGNSYSNGSSRAPIFYDQNNTGFFIDPNADLSIRVDGEICNSNYQAGFMQPGALNIGRTDRDYGWDGTSWASDVRPGIMANCSELWEFVIHDSGDSVESVFRYDGGDQLLMGRNIGWGTLYIEAARDFRAPIFYDSNDTGYYVNPNGISRIGGIQINAANPIQNEIRFYGVTGDAPNSYNHTGIFERIWRSGDESELLIFKGNDPDTSTIHDRLRLAATGRVVFHSWNTYGTIDDYMGSVGGNINGSGFFNGNDLYVTGNVIAYFSDERLKDIIGTIPNALDKIMSLTGFYYTNNETAKECGYTDDSVQLGLSAQAVQKVCPEVVTAAGFDVEADGNSISGENYLTVQYDRLIPVLVEAIKEQQTEMNEMKSEIVELKKLLTELLKK